MTLTIETGLTRQLADFAAELQFSDLPADVVHEAKRALIDHLGVALAAAGDPAVARMVRVAHRCAGAGRHTVIGRSETLGMPYAALVNGFSAHLLDYDDTYNPGDTTVHGSAPVWPAIFALAETARSTGAQAVTAFVVGFETECRLGRAAGDAHYEIGWHVTGTVGHVGAAAAAGRLLGLTPDTLTQALGSAATQSAGLKAVYGTDGKPLHAGKAAMDGLLAALMADEGMTSSRQVAEDPRGFLAVMSTDPAPHKLVEGLGQEWLLLSNGYKAYPSGSLTHPAIDAVLQLRNEHPFTPTEVRGITATVNPKAATVTGKTNPRTGLEAKFSLTHGIAAAVEHTRPRMNHFTDATATGPRLAAMRDKVTVQPDARIGKHSAVVTIEFTDGRSLTCQIAHNKGTPDNPMTDTELAEKFTDNAAPRLGAEAAAAVLSTCWNLDAVNDFGSELVQKTGARA